MVFCRDRQRVRVLDEGMRRIQKEMDFSHFMIKFFIMWQRLKQEVSKSELRRLRFGKKLLINTEKPRRDDTSSSDQEMAFKRNRQERDTIDNSRN